MNPHRIMEHARKLGWPARSGLSTHSADERAIRTRRSPLLRLRIADLDTRLVDLTGNNKDVMQGLQAIANE